MASIQLIQNFAVANFPTLIIVVGSGTSFSGTPFTLSGGTSPSITSQVCDSAKTARIYLNPGTAAGTLTITDTGSGASASITVRAAAPTLAVTALASGAEVTYVDPVSGNDSTGSRGSRSSPFLTLTAALAVALAGDTVQILPGVETVSNTGAWINAPAKVNIRGSGLGITTLNKTGTQSILALALTPGSNSTISDLSIVTSMVATSNAASIGFQNTANPPPTNITVSRCSFLGYNDAAYFNPTNVIATCTWRVRDCQFYSFFDTFNYVVANHSEKNTFAPDIGHCAFTVFGDPATTNHVSRGISYSSGNSGNMYARVSDCTINVTGGNSSGNAYGIFVATQNLGNTMNCNIDVINTSIAVATIGSGSVFPINAAAGSVNDLGGNSFTGGSNQTSGTGVITTAFGGETTPLLATVQVNQACTFQIDPLNGGGGSYVVTVNSAVNGVIATVTMASGNTPQAFSYTWTAIGSDLLTFSNNGNLANPPAMAINIVPEVPLADEVRFGTTFGPDANGATIGTGGGGSIPLNNTLIYSLGQVTGNNAIFG